MQGREKDALGSAAFKVLVLVIFILFKDVLQAGERPVGLHMREQTAGATRARGARRWEAGIRPVQVTWLQ